MVLLGSGRQHLLATADRSSSPGSRGTLVEQDTDGDGLTDTEEGWWGTNPNVADTDGDGVEDGAEIAQCRAGDVSAGIPWPDWPKWGEVPQYRYPPGTKLIVETGGVKTSVDVSGELLRDYFDNNEASKPKPFAPRIVDLDLDYIPDAAERFVLGFNPHNVEYGPRPLRRWPGVLGHHPSR